MSSEAPESAQNRTAFRWNAKRSEAAVLCAEDKLSDEKIADRVGISRTQLATWKRHPDFAERVQTLVAEMERAILKRGIARRASRLRSLQDRHDRLEALIEARAEEHQNVPGGATGALVRQVKLSPSGVEVEEYAFDRSVFAELRETEKHAAQEVGQWTERRSVSFGDIRREAEKISQELGVPVETVLREAGVDVAED